MTAKTFDTQGGLPMNTQRRSPRASARLLAGVAGAALLGLCGAAHGQFVNGQAASVVLGQKDFMSNTQAVSRRGEYGPIKTVFDHLGNMWLSDSCNSRVLEFKRPFTTDMPASLVIGAPDFTTTNTPGCGTPVAPTSGANFNFTVGLAFDPSGGGILWVPDFSDNRVLLFLSPFSSGMSACCVFGQPNLTSNAPGGGKTGLNGPADIAFDPYGNVWMADANNNRVVGWAEIRPGHFGIVKVIGQANFKGAACATTRSGLCSPNAIAFDYLGDLWVVDGLNSRILEFRPPLVTGMSASVVLGQKDFVSSAPSAGRAGLNVTPFHGSGGITFGEGAAMWVADTGNNRVVEFRRPFVTGMNASLVLGQDTFFATTPATTAKGMTFATGLAFDFSDTLWVSDNGNNRVLGFKPGGGK